MIEDELLSIGNVFKSVKHSISEFVVVDKVDSPLTNWIGIERLKSGHKETVDRSDLRPITTTKEHLDKLGFKQETINQITFYTRGNIRISGFYVDTGRLKVLTGFRLVHSWQPWNDIGKYFVDGDFDLEAFNNDFLELNELNTLYNLLKSEGMTLPDIKDILEPLY